MNAINVLSAAPWVERLGWTLVHFLWQGVLIAAVYGAARFLARISLPRWRYALAVAALAAMAVAPVATWFALGASGSAGAVVRNMVSTQAPGSITVVTATPAVVIHSPSLLPWVVLAWLTGAIVFSLRLIGGWTLAMLLRSRFVRPAPLEWQQRFERLAARVRVSRPVRLLLSGLVQTPAVIGWLRPVVLVPAGVFAGLPPDQIEALLVHELAHIRRVDYLAGILQSIVEALLFYHPAVWWVSGHIRAEREHCCDDIAVSVTADVVTYARALAAMETSRLSPVYMAANGGSLVRRIARLLGQQRPVAARTPAASAAVVCGALAVIAAISLSGQTQPRPKFEVASVKPSSEQRFMAVRPLRGGRLAATATVRMHIINAFGLAPYQVVGGPAWIDSDRYAIDAKAEKSDASRADLMLMLQSLLEDRFQLRSHRETRDLPAYALVVSKGGPKLPVPKDVACVDPNSDPGSAPGQPPTVPCGRVKIVMDSSRVQMIGAAVPMAELAKMLSGALGRSVIDKTGYTAKFDLHLEFTPDLGTAGLPAGAVPAADPSGAPAPADVVNPSIFTAVQEQLGLKLESSKSPVEVLVIDSVAKPTAN